MYRNITKVNELIDIYPGKDNGNSVEVTASNDNKYTANLHIEEVELCLFLNDIKKKLTDAEFKKLSSLIDNYGSMKYGLGADNEYFD